MNRVLDLALLQLVLAADTSHTLGTELSSAVLGVVGVHNLLVGLAIDALIGIVEQWARNWVLKVVMPLRDVRPCNVPARSSVIAKVALLLPVTNQGAVAGFTCEFVEC